MRDLGGQIGLKGFQVLGPGDVLGLGEGRLVPTLLPGLLADGAPLGVNDVEPDPQVRWDGCGVPAIGVDDDPGQSPQCSPEFLGERGLTVSIVVLEPGQRSSGTVGSGDELGLDPFGEGPDELGGQLGAQTRNLPAERSGRHLVEQG